MTEDEWGEPVQGTPKKLKGVIVSIRFTTDEIAEVRAAAAAWGMTVSEYLRDLAARNASLRIRPSAAPAQPVLASGGSLSSNASYPYTTWVSAGSERRTP